MGWINKGGAMKWLQGGGGWNTATGGYTEPEGEPSLLSTAMDRRNPNSMNIPYQQTPYERSSGVDSSTFNVTDTKQVKAVQKMLGLKGDGVFGPKTQAAWRDYVDRGRQDAGLESYFYEDAPQSGANYVNSGRDVTDIVQNVDSGARTWSDILGPGGFADEAKKGGY